KNCLGQFRDCRTVWRACAREIKTKDGVYVVAAYNRQSAGRVFALAVQGKDRLIYALEEGKPIESAEDRIDVYAFVRPFIVCTQK
ncbi:hypothetical protein L917_04819, partial [Phytophthora nicotianae]